MDTLTLEEIKLRVACGEFACLRACCDLESLQAIQALLANRSQHDLAVISRVLCGGCSTQGGGPLVPNDQTGPTQNFCVNKLLEWMRDNRLIVNALQVGLEMAAPLAKDPRIMIAIDGVASLLEMLEDLEASKTGTPADEIFNALCSFSLWRAEIRDAVAGMAPDFAKSIVDLLVKFDSLTSIGEQCCKPGGPTLDLPTGEGGGGGTGSGGTPPPATGGGGTGSGGQPPPGDVPVDTIPIAVGGGGPYYSYPYYGYRTYGASGTPQPTTQLFKPVR